MSDEAPPLSDEQKELFEVVTSGEYSNIVAMSGTFEDHPVAYVCAVDESGPEVLIRPLAIIVDKAFLDRFGKTMKEPSNKALKE